MAIKNQSLKTLALRRPPKSDREQAVLLGVVELYLRTGKPIGSQTLQESGFESLSSATIRNYFAKMEEEGYLNQQHTSGGRIPTTKAFRLYADHVKGKGFVDKEQAEAILAPFEKEGKEIATLIHRAAEALSEQSKCAVFISSPRFDHDFIQETKLIRLGPMRLLSVLITDFGLIRTEILHLETMVDELFLRSVEEYFLWRMNKGEKPLFRDELEAKMAQRIYNEVMVRHVVGYANFPVEEVLRTGLSKLLSYPEFNGAEALARSLSLLEDDSQMRDLLRECCKEGILKTWIGDELCPRVPAHSECSVIAIPYRINQTIAGAVALLGPMRLPYQNIFGLLEAFSDRLSRKLTDTVYKFKISFRAPEGKQLEWTK